MLSAGQETETTISMETKPVHASSEGYERHGIDSSRPHKQRRAVSCFQAH